jgi:hypothetical protein
VYFTSFTNNPNFKRKTFFIFAAVLQFLVLASGVFFMIKARADFGHSSNGGPVVRPMQQGGGYNNIIGGRPGGMQGGKTGYE